MIKLTRLGGEPFILNADMIRYVEARPDTFITMLDGERVIVTESMDEVLRRTVVYQQIKHLIPPPQHPQLPVRPKVPSTEIPSTEIPSTEIPSPEEN